MCGNQPNQPSKKKTDFSLSHIWLKSPIYAEPQPSSSCFKTVNIYLEPEGCSLVSILYNTFSCQKFPYKTHTELPKHECLSLIVDD